MKLELTQRFCFEAARTLERAYETESSRCIQGHTYRAAVTVSGPKEPKTGMVVDLAVLRASIAELCERLDHRFLDEMPELRAPTLESLCLYICWSVVSKHWIVEHLEVERPASGDLCHLTL